MNITLKFDKYIEDAADTIKQQMESRSYRAANELRNSALEVLRGQRNGRRYKVPGTYATKRDKTGTYVGYRKKTRKNGRYYTASAPGEPPAVRTGAFRQSWQASAAVVYGSYISRIESNIKTDNGGYTLGEILENGTSRMAPRPYQDKILEKAEPKIRKIYKEPYF